jgi:hypothetical protein
LGGLREVSQQRVVTRVLAVMGIEAAHRPADLHARADHGAIEVDGHAPQVQSTHLSKPRRRPFSFSCPQKTLMFLFSLGVKKTSPATTDPDEFI